MTFDDFVEETLKAIVSDAPDARLALKERLELAYRQGYVDALCNYSTWRDGEQTIGALQRPLKTILEEFKTSKVPLRY